MPLRRENQGLRVRRSEQKVHRPSGTSYSLSIPSFNNHTGESVDRYQIIAPFLATGAYDNQVRDVSRTIDSNLSTNCSTISLPSSSPELPATNSNPTSQSVSRYSFSKRRRNTRSPKTSVLQILPHTQDQGNRSQLDRTRTTMTAGTVKRSISNPNVRQAAAMSGGVQFSIDKRRNKLGYHRTSVACGMPLNKFAIMPSVIIDGMVPDSV